MAMHNINSLKKKMIYRKTYDLTAKLPEKKREREMEPSAPDTVIMTPKSWREIKMNSRGAAE